MTMIEVDLWFANFTEFDAPTFAARYADWLDDDETRRRDRFVFPRDQVSFACSHVVLRHVLSRYEKVAPAAWRFEFNNWGKPRLTADSAPADSATPAGSLEFNLSHTRGAALVGVVRGAELGVDIEMTERDASCLELADRYFSPSEVAALHALPAEQQRERFFELWTLKEAYIKARGMGLAIPLDQFSYAFPAEYSRHAAVAPTISFTPPLIDTPGDWQFVQRPLTPTFRAAAAVRNSVRRQFGSLGESSARATSSKVRTSASNRGPSDAERIAPQKRKPSRSRCFARVELYFGVPRFA
ncbi:MAG: 4'-phosphopantetheinyl transferase superfamily protein [Pirellulales bacterium]